MPLICRVRSESGWLLFDFTADVIDAYAAALPPAAPGGALAYGSWLRPDGNVRFAFRISADEIKTIGSAVTALTAAGGDDDDE